MSVVTNIGTRTTDNVTVNTVSGSTPGPYTVTLSAAVPATTVIGDVLTTGANTFLIEGKSGSDLTVYKRHLGASADPATGAATTTRAHSTLQAWEDAVPATPTGGYIGECYNDSQFTGGVLISGHTTSPTDYITLTAAAGQSFQDHASVRSNPLYYDQSKGVGISRGGGTAPVVQVDNNNVTISRLQIRQTAATYSYSIVEFSVDNQPANTIRDCIIGHEYTSAFTAAVVNIRNGKAINCLIYCTDSTPPTALYMRNHYGTAEPLVLNCTLIATAGGGTIGVDAANSGNASKLQNCAIFGYTTPATHNGGSWASGSNYNATDQASGLPGANSIYNRVAATDFESATVDFRLKAGAGLIGTGNTDATNAPNDVSAYARGSGTAGDIGAWEASATSTAVPVIASQYRQRRL